MSEALAHPDPVPQAPAHRSVALCMLVSSDEPLLARSLDAARGLIDAWVLLDTTGNREHEEIAFGALGEIPGEYHESRWADFGRNRSELLYLARGAADYLLLLDPDEVAVGSAKLGPPDFDAYHVTGTRTDPEEQTIRIVRSDRHWWFEGATHEVLCTNGRYTEGRIDGLRVEYPAGEDGLRRFRLRQLDLLSRDAATEADLKRTSFYLAETLRELGMYDGAIGWYGLRTELGDADEETYYAHLQRGLLMAERDVDAAVPVLLEAWHRRPRRAEALHELARRFGDAGDSGLAYLFADLGLQIPRTSDARFVDDDIYDWGLRFQRGWAACRLGRNEESAADLRAVLEVPGVPESVVTFINERLDTPEWEAARWSGGTGEAPLPARLGALVEGLQLGRVSLDLPTGWPAFNPSITADGDGFAMLVRTGNIEYTHGQLVFDGNPENESYLVSLDGELAVTGVEPLDERAAGFEHHAAEYGGFQDLHPIWVGGQWLAVGNSWELSESEGQEMAVLELDGATVAKVHRLVGPQPGRREKNWMPFVRDDALHLVYSCAPTVVFRCDTNDGSLATVTDHEAPPVASYLRGGSQGLPQDDGGFLFVVHETYFAPERRYSHRLLRLFARTADRRALPTVHLHRRGARVLRRRRDPRAASWC